ncbi:MAG: terpene cyclase/mutase family protein [Planctomycetes bacterium]|nr:terpene cyclase/mutase family protein [Planctomycetota bacterium]
MTGLALAAAMLATSAVAQGDSPGATPDTPPIPGLVRQKYAPRSHWRDDAPKPVVEAVEAGLRWLDAYQDDDGRWDCDGFNKHDRAGDPCDGPGAEQYDVGITGIAMLALLAEGSTLRDGRYQRALGKAADWLAKAQGADGLIGTRAVHDYFYGHAIASYALCEAFGLSADPRLATVGQRALDHIEAHRNPYSVWRYQPRDNDNDTSVTSWCVMACVTGETFGLRVNPTGLELAGTWLDQITDPSDGRHGYVRPGGVSPRWPGDHATRFPPEFGETMTAIGLFCRCCLGQDPAERQVMRRGFDLIACKPPRWEEDRGTIDLYYWYYGLHALAQVGGSTAQKWRQSAHAALLPSQRVDGNFAGSWDPVCAWGDAGGRVYSTAMAVLCLLAEYRYARFATLTPLPDKSSFSSANRAWLEGDYGRFARVLDIVAERPGLAEDLRPAIAEARLSLRQVDDEALGDVEGIRGKRDYFRGPDRLAKIAERYGDLGAGVAARALLDEWRNDPAVKLELAAMDKLQVLRKRWGGAVPENRKTTVVRALQQFVERYPDTRAAAEAKGWLAQLR